MSTERFNERLIALLKTNPDFVDSTGDLLRNRVKSYAWEFDHDLISLLLTDEEIESKFFEEVNGRWIFNNNTFVNYLNDMNFLDRSYTQFRNKIGLNIDDKFLHERGEVALVWPYKDCILEGGQTTGRRQTSTKFSSTNSSLQMKLTECSTRRCLPIGNATPLTGRRR